MGIPIAPVEPVSMIFILVGFAFVFTRNVGRGNHKCIVSYILQTEENI